MNCPKCSTEESKGFLIGPYWEKSQQGKVECIRCVSCGFRVYHPTFAVYYKTSEKGDWENISQEGVDRVFDAVVRQLVTGRSDGIIPKDFDVDNFEF